MTIKHPRHDAYAAKVEQNRKLQVRIAKLEAALRDIAEPGYGIEMHDADNERAEYWSSVALRLRTIARAALEAK